MRFENYHWAASVIAAHPNHEVYGRTRLQKTVKLLQRLGMPSDYSFQIHFYGPYSETLQSDIALIEELGLGVEECKPARDGSFYYLLRSEPFQPGPDLGPWIKPLQLMANADLIVLELAATYDAFREQGASHEEAMKRLRVKKGKKCEEGREDYALSLLSGLGLPH
jgi:hypothetical protein